MIDHDTEIRNKKNATEASEGYTGDTYCKICDTKIKSSQSIPKIVNKEQETSNSKTVYVTETGNNIIFDLIVLVYLEQKKNLHFDFTGGKKQRIRTLFYLLLKSFKKQKSF